MVDMRDKFDAGLRKNIAQVHKTNKAFKNLKALADEHPATVGMTILQMLPTQMDALEKEAADFGISLGDRGDWEKVLQRRGTIENAFKVVTMADSYERLREAKARIELQGRNLACSVVDTEEFCRSVCDIYLEMLKGIQAGRVGLVAALQKRLPNNFEDTALATVISGYLIAHISLRHNKRLRAAIDSLREEGESGFARLLKELPAEALEHWNESPRYTGDLMNLRTAVAHALEEQGAQPKENELAEFVNREQREKLLKRARAAGLTPREHELFALLLEHPRMKLREAADKLGVSVGTVKSLKSRIKKTLAA